MDWGEALCHTERRLGMYLGPRYDHAYSMLIGFDLRTIDVRVGTTPTYDGLQLIFDHVRTTGDRADSGYFVQINCVSDGTRLANGKFAIGRLGAAQTGLPAGGHEFEVVAGRACPA